MDGHYDNTYNEITYNDFAFNDNTYSMIPMIQNNFILYKTEAGKNRVGSKRKRERDRQRGVDLGGERRSIGENMKWRGLRNDHWKKTPEYFE